MPVTTLDRTSALIIIDLQQGIAALPSNHSFADVVRHARRLADAFRERHLPVVLVNVAGRAPGRTEQPPRLPDPLPADWAELLPEIGRQDEDILVTKHSWGAFTRTGLEDRLRSLGVTQVVIAGIATGVGVETTARQAYELGFNVTLAVDAMTDSRPQAHDHCLTLVFPRLGETGTTEEIVALLAVREE
jgi:nicotinamidase-related amidase